MDMKAWRLELGGLKQIKDELLRFAIKMDVEKEDSSQFVKNTRRAVTKVIRSQADLVSYVVDAAAVKVEL